MILHLLCLVCKESRITWVDGSRPVRCGDPEKQWGGMMDAASSWDGDIYSGDDEAYKWVYLYRAVGSRVSRCDIGCCACAPVGERGRRSCW